MDRRDQPVRSLRRDTRSVSGSIDASNWLARATQRHVDLARAINGRPASRPRRQGDSSADDGASSSAEPTDVIGAIRRRAGAGPEYHLREMYMNSGAARKIDE